jgi:general secretion pathway protein H
MARTEKHRSGGFTLLELLVVIAIMAVATAGVSLALRDTSQTALEREAQRLAVLFESARAQSRASGIAVVWRTTPDGFRFEGLPAGALPERWLSEGITVRGNGAVQLGPEPIIGRQAIEVVFSPSGGVLPHVATLSSQTQQVVRVATDGLRPFALEVLGPP